MSVAQNIGAHSSSGQGPDFTNAALWPHVCEAIHQAGRRHAGQFARVLKHSARHVRKLLSGERDLTVRQLSALRESGPAGRIVVADACRVLMGSTPATAVLHRTVATFHREASEVIEDFLQATADGCVDDEERAHILKELDEVEAIVRVLAMELRG